MKTWQAVMAFLLVHAISGCATITRGTTDVLVIESEPSGATVTTSTGLSGKTPTSFKVSRKGGFVVKIEKEGYEPVEVQVNSKVAGSGAAGMAGNIILGGLIGAAVDAGTGATLDLMPNPIKVKLVSLAVPEEKAAEPAKKEPISFYINFKPLSQDLVEVTVSEDFTA